MSVITAMVIIMILAGASASRLDHRRYLRGMSGIGCLLLISEVWKQWTLTFIVNGGHYNVWYFPFQLCSLPLWLCPLMVWMPVRWQRRIQVFLMDFTLMGGIAVFLDTSGMQYTLLPLTIHSYVWHLTLIFIGSWSGFDWVRRQEDLAIRREGQAIRREGQAIWKGSLAVWLDSLKIWLPCVNIATLLNVLLWRFGEISMFYISPFEASTQMVIHDIAVRYGIQVGNSVYLAVMLLAAAVFHMGWQVLRCRCITK